MPYYPSFEIIKVPAFIRLPGMAHGCVYNYHTAVFYALKKLFKFLCFAQEAYSIFPGVYRCTLGRIGFSP